MIKPVDKYICYWIKMCATTVILFSHFNCNSNDFKQQKSFLCQVWQTKSIGWCEVTVGFEVAAFMWKKQNRICQKRLPRKVLQPLPPKQSCDL